MMLHENKTSKWMLGTNALHTYYYNYYYFDLYLQMMHCLLSNKILWYMLKCTEYINDKLHTIGIC